MLIVDNAAVTDFQCRKVIAKVNKEKNSDMENCICSQYGEQLAILNTENVEIYEWITKVEAIKMQFCWICN